MDPDILEELNKLEVRVATGRDRVFKDECVYSYENPEGHNGMYICFKTFYGVGKFLLPKHAQLYESRLFLHHKKNKRVVPDVASTTDANGTVKRKRLAIGVEGGFSAEQKFEYDDVYSLLLLPQNISIKYPNSELPQNIKNAVEALLNAESANRVAQAKAGNESWDGEFRQISKFANDLPQLANNKKIPRRKASWVCEYPGCNIKEGLWLNLTDGSILCGRKMYDGSGGNNHAEEHFKEHGYPLVVKLGTITADSADVYSYEEDDMVLDPKLTEHLLHWGIERSEMNKSEKTMAELEIEWNEKYNECTKMEESDKQLTNLYGAGYTGMENLGNSCYLNSIMQVLFSLPPVIARYASHYEKILFPSLDGANIPRCGPPDNLNMQLAKLGYGLTSGLYSIRPKDEHRKGIRPLMFKNIIGKDHRDFQTAQQQDAYEFFVHILSKMESHSKSLPKPDSFGPANPAKLFQINWEIRLKDTASEQVRYNKDNSNVWELTIPLDRASNAAQYHQYRQKEDEAKQKGETVDDVDVVIPIVPFEACVEKFMEEEGVDDVYSTAAKRKTLHCRKTRFSTFPPYLMVRLLRYVYTTSADVKKVEVSVKMPNELDLEFFRGKGLGADEVQLPEETEEDVKIQAELKAAAESSAPARQAASINEELVAQLQEFGFTRNACIKAIRATGSNDAQAATNWILEHSGDADLNDPVIEQSSSGDSTVPNGDTAVEQSNIRAITDMGLTEVQARNGLKKFSGNVPAAIEWIFSNPDESMLPLEEDNQEQDDQPMETGEMDDDAASPMQNGSQEVYDGTGRYRLKAFISHMGPSTSSGHYVCHIYKNKQWVIYNDEKVARSETPPRELAYLYLYERVVDQFTVLTHLSSLIQPPSLDNIRWREKPLIITKYATVMVSQYELYYDNYYQQQKPQKCLL